MLSFDFSGGENADCGGGSVLRSNSRSIAMLCLFAVAGRCVAESPKVPLPRQIIHLGQSKCMLAWFDSKVSLSESTLIELAIEGPAPVEVDLPVQLSVTKDWVVQVGQTSTYKVENGREVWSVVIRFEPYATGERVKVELPPIPFRVGNEVRQWEVRFDPVNIHVTSSVLDPKLGSAKPVLTPDFIPKSDSTRMTDATIGGFVLLIVLCAAFIALMIRRSGYKDIPIASPRDSAMAKLQSLEARREPIAADAAALSQLVREYLNRQYGIPTEHLTTLETFACIQANLTVSPEQQSRIQRILSAADLIKFAGTELQLSIWNELIADCRIWLDAETVPAAPTNPISEDRANS